MMNISALFTVTVLLQAAPADFNAVAKAKLPAANAALNRKQLWPIKLMTRQEWEAKQQAGS